MKKKHERTSYSKDVSLFDESILGKWAATYDSIAIIFVRCKIHPKIRLIKELASKLDKTFSIEKISYEDFHKEITKLDIKKTYQDTDLHARIIKENVDIFKLQ